MDDLSLSKNEMLLKFFLVTTSESTIGLSLSIYCWKALCEQNMNM